jgi:hypothetical protein
MVVIEIAHGNGKRRSPLQWCFWKPVHEFDPRPVRKNIGDAPSKLDEDDPA